MRWLARLFFDVVKDRVSLSELLVRLGLHDLAQSKAPAIEHSRHGTGRGQWLRLIPLLAERLQCRLDCQPAGGQAGAACGVWLRLGFGELTQGLRHVRML